MGERNALLDDLPFEDDFDSDFGGSDDFGSSGLGFEGDLGASLTGGASQAPEGGALDPDAMSMADQDMATGNITVPHISVQAFCERSGTAKVIEAASTDRRLARANIQIEEGGLSRAIEVFETQPTPDLLIIESSLTAQQMLAQIDRLAELCDPDIRVLVIGAMNDVQLYRQLVARGVSEYLVPPFKPLQLINSISALYVDPDRPFVGRSVAVVGAKGGVGSSTIAHNLAWSITENVGVNATLVDLDLSWGTTALDFNHEGAQTVVDALTDPDRVDSTVLDRLLTKATDRLSLFTAPSTLNTMYEIADEAYEEVINHVRKNVPFVVLDLPHMWSEWMRASIVNADDVIVVCQPDLASLRNGKNLIDYLKNARANDTPPRLILNMVGVPKRPEIPVKDFAAAIGLDPSLVLPFEPQLFGQASNNGQMISEAQPDAKSSQGIDHLASQLTGRSVEVRKESLIGKMLKFGK